MSKLYKNSKSLEEINPPADVTYSESLRTISIAGEITNNTYHLFDLALSALELKSKKEVLVRLTTEGGEIVAGMAIAERIRTSECDITIHAISEVKSIGIFILASGDRRISSNLCEYLHHEDIFELSEANLSTQVRKIREAVKSDRIRCKWLSERTGQKKDFWIKLGSKGDYIFYAEEAQKLGLIDEIIEI